MKKQLIGLIIAISGALLAAGCGSGDQGIRIGLECDYAPFNWTEAKSNECTIQIANNPGKYADG